MYSRLTLIAALFLFPAPAALAAQETSPPPRQSTFEKLFPHPTGENGLEEMALAGDLLAQSKPFGQATRNATLTAKREALADADVIRARQLLRQGLSKPLRSLLSDTEIQQGFPAFSLLGAFRSAARLLDMEQYVLFADGRTGEAVDSLRDGLRLTYFLKSQAMIGGLSGSSIESIGLNRCARHIDQLSARDCERLLVVIRDYLKAPDPAVTALEWERQMQVAMLSDTLRYQLERLPTPEEEKVFEEDTEIPAALKVEMQRLIKDPSARDALRAGVLQRINWHYDALIAQVRLPVRPDAQGVQEPPVTFRQGDTVADNILGPILSVTESFPARAKQGQARLRLLAVHAAIRRYRWEHDRLPSSLSVLKLRDLARDPFTGKVLTYRITGDAAYTLSSAGPRKLDDEGKPVGQEREPVSLLLPRRTTPAPPQP